MAQSKKDKPVDFHDNPHEKPPRKDLRKPRRVDDPDLDIADPDLDMMIEEVSNSVKRMKRRLKK